MIVFYGKGKVGNAFRELCTFVGKPCILMDDSDHNSDVLMQATIIVPTPGISQQHAIYQQHSDKIISEMDMCQTIMDEQALSPLSIGITGTDGKSTVTRLIAEALQQLLPEYHIHITGNFDEPLGKTILDILQKSSETPAAKDNNIFVIECSSFMLYPTRKYHFSLSAWTNFASDHLNRHPNMDEYFTAKQQIVANSDLCLVTTDVYKKISPLLLEKALIAPTAYDITKTHFVGQHNEKNCAMAFTLIKLFCAKHGLVREKMSVNDQATRSNMSAENLLHHAENDPREILVDQKIYSAINTIKPLKHRMQPVKTIQDIIRYDDGKSTSSQSLGAALASFSEPIILICGGSDKGDSFEHLAPLFSHNVAHGVFLGQTSPLFASIFDQCKIPHTITDTMANTVKIARDLAQETNTKVILFSPGCASFDLFKNYEDRAQQFLAAIDSIESTIERK